MQTKAVILAAGQGTRMHSELPKVLHPLLGHPLAWYALEAARQATQAQPVMVIGHAGRGCPPGLGDAADYVVAGASAGHRARRAAGEISTARPGRSGAGHLCRHAAAYRRNPRRLVDQHSKPTPARSRC